MAKYAWLAFFIFFTSILQSEGAAAGNAVVFAWSGAAGVQSATVNAQLAQDSNDVRLMVSERDDLSSPMLSGTYTATMATNRVVSIPVSGLTPNTQYYYALAVNGLVYSGMQGQFHTYPNYPSPFTFALSGDANTGSDHSVFETIRTQNPLFFLHLGDLFYENIDVNDINLYRSAYDAVLASPGQASLYRNVTLNYMWDDHDYGPNNSDSTSPSRQAARLAYQEYVPHYPLAAGSGDVPIYHSFSVGRVRFIVTDTRSERTPNAAPDNSSKSMLGSAQKAWFKQQLLDANGNYPIIFWVNSVPWIFPPTPGADAWGGFTHERAELADFMVNNNIEGLFMVSADAHMLAIDDGSNTNYSQQPGAGFALMHAAALDRTGSLKGGPYSEGAIPGGGQFGLITVHDNGGDTICMDWSGRDAGNNELIAWGTCVPAPPLSKTNFIYLPALSK